MSYLGFDFHKAHDIFIKKHNGDIAKADEEFLMFIKKVRDDYKKAKLQIKDNCSGSAGVQPEPEATDRLTESHWLPPSLSGVPERRE